MHLEVQLHIISWTKEDSLSMTDNEHHSLKFAIILPDAMSILLLLHSKCTYVWFVFRKICSGKHSNSGLGVD